jgi:hypothetical protein
MKTRQPSTNPAPTESALNPQSHSQPALASKERPAPKASVGARSQSKQDRVIAMLRRTDGTTIAAVMKATGWQKHSVHGFLAGVVPKKLKLNLVSEKSDGKRVYRIADGKRSTAGPSRRKQAA